MKTLYLLRHCKSDWSEAMQRDFDRPLNDRGRENAPLVCALLKNELPFPGTHLAISPAKRTRQTIEPLISAWGEAQKNRIDWNESLYESGLNEYLTVIRSTPDEAETLLIVGHNPSVQHTTEYLVSGRRLDDLVHVGTGTLLCLPMNIRSWKQAAADCAVLKWMISPKLLKKASKL